MAEEKEYCIVLLFLLLLLLFPLESLWVRGKSVASQISLGIFVALERVLNRGLFLFFFSSFFFLLLESLWLKKKKDC